MARYAYASEVKIAFLGSSQTGKTCLLTNFFENRFIEHYDPTIGVEYKRQPYNIGRQYITLHMWDSGSQEGYKPESSDYLDQADAFAIVFDITRKETYDELASIFSQLWNSKNRDKPTILIGNKKDLEDSRQVLTREGEFLARANETKYFETSALTFDNVGPAFRYLINEVVSRAEEQGRSEEKVDDYYWN